MLAASLVTFAFATVVGWYWYGENCWQFLCPARSPRGFRLMYILSAFLGAPGGLEVLWTLGGILGGLMALPNLLSLFLLRREASETLEEETAI